MKNQAALAAKEIKQILKSVYPEIVFNVKSDNYSGGNSVRVSYTDGPVTSEVEKHVAHFQMGNFDGMNDIYEYSNTRTDIPQTKYLFVERYMSDEAKSDLMNYLRENYYGCKDLNFEDYSKEHGEWVSTLIRRLFYKKDFYFVDFAELLN